MRLALTLALQDFEGALIVVSHDRHLLRTVADELWLVSDGQAKVFDGDLDDYRQWTLNKDKPEKVTNETSSNSNKKKGDRRAAAEARQKLQPLRNAVKKSEQLMEKVQKKLDEVEEKLADSEIYGDSNKEKLKALLVEQGNLKTELEQAEMDWFEASEQLEEAQD
jgi:ATP-binding cassette subfamily F protein 3